MIQRNIGVFSAEAEYVAELERKTNSCLNMTEQSNFNQWLNRNAYDLMTNHSNLLIISASKYRSWNSRRQTQKETCVVLYVHIKGYIPYGEKPFPKRLDGFSIDVRESMFEFQTKPNVKYENVRTGCSIATAYSTSGTLGGFLKSDRTENIYGLTCCHIFKTKKTKHIFKKAKSAGRSHNIHLIPNVYQPVKKKGNFIGKLIQFVDNETSDEYVTVDAAVIDIERRHPVNWCISTAEEFEVKQDCQNFEDQAFDKRK